MLPAGCSSSHSALQAGRGKGNKVEIRVGGVPYMLLSTYLAGPETLTTSLTRVHEGKFMTIEQKPTAHVW